MAYGRFTIQAVRPMYQIILIGMYVMYVGMNVHRAHTEDPRAGAKHE